MRLLRGLGLVVAAATLFLLGGLGWAHVHVRAQGGALPEPEALLALAEARPLPTRVWRVTTAVQPAPRGQVLTPSRDPSPDRPYQLGHAAFVLEWADGRTLLVDTGMRREAAVDFAATLALVGAGELRFLGDVSERLGAAALRPQLGLVLTHLHVDHTDGIAALCDARAAAPIALFQLRAQAEESNFTTRPARSAVEEATCLTPTRLPEEPVAALPGFPGVGVIHAAGHTPGSQVVIAQVRTAAGIQPIAFTGDVANQVDGIRHDVPKPLAYRLLVVPEAEDRLRRVRGLLRALESEHGFVLAVSHDALHLETLPIPEWPQSTSR